MGTTGYVAFEGMFQSWSAEGCAAGITEMCGNHGTNSCGSCIIASRMALGLF